MLHNIQTFYFYNVAVLYWLIDFGFEIIRAAIVVNRVVSNSTGSRIAEAFYLHGLNAKGKIDLWTTLVYFACGFQCDVRNWNVIRWIIVGDGLTVLPCFAATMLLWLRRHHGVPFRPSGRKKSLIRVRNANWSWFGLSPSFTFDFGGISSTLNQNKDSRSLGNEPPR